MKSNSHRKTVWKSGQTEIWENFRANKAWWIKIVTSYTPPHVCVIRKPFMIERDFPVRDWRGDTVEIGLNEIQRETILGDPGAGEKFISSAEGLFCTWNKLSPANIASSRLATLAWVSEDGERQQQDPATANYNNIARKWKVEEEST